MARSSAETEQIINDLRRWVQDLRAQMRRMITAVDRVAPLASKRPGGGAQTYLLSVLSQGGLLTENPTGTLGEIAATGSTGLPLVGASDTTPPGYSRVNGQLGIAAGSIGGADTLNSTIHIEENSIGTADFSPLSVDTAALGGTSVTTAKIALLNITNALIATQTIVGASPTPGNSKIAVGSISVEDLATDAVETVKIKDLNVTTAKLALKAITQGTIGDLAVGTGQLEATSVTAAKMENVATQIILGRNTGGAGSREQLSPSVARTVMDVESATNYAATTSSKGASLIGLEDSDGYTTATDVEAALAELYGSRGDSIVLGLRRSGTWTVGQRIQGWTDTTDGFCRLRIPSGTTFEVTMVGCHIQNGSRSGTYAYRAGVTEYSDDTSTGSATPRYAVDSLEWTDTTVSGHYFGYKKWDGATALASVTGGAAISILPFLMSEASSPGTTTSDNCHVIVVGRFV